MLRADDPARSDSASGLGNTLVPLDIIYLAGPLMEVFDLRSFSLTGAHVTELPGTSRELSETQHITVRVFEPGDTRSAWRFPNPLLVLPRHTVILKLDAAL
jgi:hypothetical protein